MHRQPTYMALMRFGWLLLPLSCCLVTSCKKRAESADQLHPRESNYHQDVVFLTQHTKIHVLREEGGGRVAVAPDWQGRVMTSSATGDEGRSQGWIAYYNIRDGIKPDDQRQGMARHIHLFGGEERLWLGPEGGQHALFFPPKVPYELEHWKVPAVLDTEPFEVISASATAIQMRKDAVLTNRAGTKFPVHIARAVQILDKLAMAQWLGVPIPDELQQVGYMSTNAITNTGKEAWNPQTGMVSLWLLGMLKPGDGTNVVIPLKPGSAPAVDTDYFENTSLDDSRFRVGENVVFFKADGAFRSKIGISPQRAKPLLGSWDPEHGRLTVVRYKLPDNAASLAYPRSQWKDHADPYAGDVANVYNGGAPLGGYYELESSSPALPLAPGQELTHVQATIHFEGSREPLDKLARELFGVGLEEIERAFEPK